MISTMNNTSDPNRSLPGPGEGKRGESGYIGYLLRQASAAVRLTLERALVDLDVTQPQFLVMTLINAYPHSSGADLARIAMLTPQTMSVIVANLERQGRLIRSAHPTNGRTQDLHLTDDGLSLLLQCRERVRALDATLIADLSPEDEAIIRRWLVHVATRAVAKLD